MLHLLQILTTIPTLIILVGTKSHSPLHMRNEKLLNSSHSMEKQKI